MDKVLNLNVFFKDEQIAIAKTFAIKIWGIKVAVLYDESYLWHLFITMEFISKLYSWIIIK